MTDRMDVVQWGHNPNGKAFPKRIGTALQKKNKPGEWRIYLDALPMQSMSRDGGKLECVVELLTPRERDTSTSESSSTSSDVGNGDFDDPEVPF